MNYTRGPLTVHHNGYEIDIEERIKAGTEVLATVHNLGRSREAEQHANAHLYAAAPQLLEALKALTEHSAGTNHAFFVVGKPKALHAAMAGQKAVLEQARAAIAQAEKGY